MEEEKTMTGELLQLSGFLKTLRKAISNDRKGISFVDRTMCVLNDIYYIKITEQMIQIKTDDMNLELCAGPTSLGVYYCSVKYLLEDLYDNKKGKRKYIKRIDFLIRRIAKKYVETIDNLAESVNLEEKR